MEISFKDLKDLLQGGDNSHPFNVGSFYHVRTVTMAIAGKLKAVHGQELVFSDASWVADSGRFNEYLRDTSKAKENELFKNDVIIGRGSVVDMTLVSSVCGETK